MVGGGVQRRRIVHFQRRPGLHAFIDQLFQTIEAAAARGDDRHHRTAEALRQRRNIDADALVFRHVQHVQRHDAGHAQFAQLKGEVEIAFKIAGVHHVDQQVRLLAQHKMAGDLLVDRRLLGNGGQRIGAGQVDKVDAGAARSEEALFTLHGHASPVADALACAGELVEQGGFSGVGIA